MVLADDTDAIEQPIDASPAVEMQTEPLVYPTYEYDRPAIDPYQTPKAIEAQRRLALTRYIVQSQQLAGYHPARPVMQYQYGVVIPVYYRPRYVNVRPYWMY